MCKKYTPMQNNNTPKIIIGIDLGTTRMGVGVISIHNNATTVLDQGIVSTIQTQDMRLRLQDIYDNLHRLIKTHNPHYVAFEDVFFVKNKKTALDVASARGIVLLVAAQTYKPVEIYTPLQVKQSITGWGRADKKQMQAMVVRLLSLKQSPKPDDVADALAVAICCAHSTAHKELLLAHNV